MGKFKRYIATTIIGVLALSNTAFASHQALNTVIHAGGTTVYGHVGTNSLEGLQGSLFNGYRYIELDFCFTTDDHLVAIHDWDINYFGLNYSENFHGAVSLYDFRQQRILGEYTPLTIETLQNWLLGKAETYIITDIKDRNIEGLKYIKENYPLIMPSIIPQVYSEAQYFEVKELGYTDIIYTLYALDYSDKTNAGKINTFARENEVLAIVFDKTLATESYVSKLKEGGVRVLAHTVNDLAEMESLKNMGIDGFYTDKYLNNY